MICQSDCLVKVILVKILDNKVKSLSKQTLEENQKGVKDQEIQKMNSKLDEVLTKLDMIKEAKTFQINLAKKSSSSTDQSSSKCEEQ